MNGLGFFYPTVPNNMGISLELVIAFKTVTLLNSSFSTTKNQNEIEDISEVQKVGPGIHNSKSKSLFFRNQINFA